MGASMYLFFSIVVAARPAVEPVAQPVVGRVLDGVVRLGPDARVQVVVQRFEPVLDDGLGFAGDLAPDPPAVRAESQADHAPPPAFAVPVPIAVTARNVMLEEDSVLAPAAP